LRSAFKGATEIAVFSLASAIESAAATFDSPEPVICFTNPTPVFVEFLGQSNMVGFNMSPATLSVAGYQPDPLTFIWNNKAGHFEVMQPGVNTPGGVGVWGPEVGFAMDFRASHPETPLYISKTNAGETSLAQDLNANDDWNVHSVGEMFDKALARTDAAAAVLGKRPDMVFIAQGEADAGDPHAASQYGQNFAEFIEAVRTRLMQDDDGYVAWTRVADSTPYWDEVRSAQLAVNDGLVRVASFDTLDRSLFTRQGDNLHLDAQGLVNVGHHFFRLFDDEFPFV
jgi:hypothetical protein